MTYSVPASRFQMYFVTNFFIVKKYRYGTNDLHSNDNETVPTDGFNKI